MIIESPEALKEWLTTVLEPMCEADPTALAKYVIALVKKDKPVAELRDTCLDQLDVFLQQETKPFVELLFKTLDNRSYLVRADAPATTIAQPTPLQLDPTPQMVAPPSGMAVISNSVAMSIATPALPNSTGSASGSKLPERRSSHPDAAVDGEDRDKQLSQAKVSSSSHTRSRSRSRSRNKSRSRSREREDRRRGRFYGEEERRRGGIVRRHDRYNSYRRDRSRERMERNRERERERDRERKRSRSRSPTRSKSRSKSRSRSRSKDKARQRPDGQKVQNSSTANQDHGDTDYRFGVPPPTALGTLSSSQNSSSIVAPVPPPGGSLDPQVAYSGRNARRCRDYDEKGVCLRGDLCPYDHGNDPVVVEEAHLPSMLAYGPNSTSTSTQIPPGPGPGPRPPGPHPGPIPPLLGPPMSHQRPLLPQPMSMMQPMGSRMFHPMSDPYVPEPYNPEAPAMDRLPPRIRPPFWGPRMGPGRMHGMRPPHQYPHPTRELINVPTVDDTSTPSESADHASTNSNRTVVLPQKRPLNEPQGPPPLPLRVFTNVGNAPEQQQQHQQQQPQQQQQQQQQPPAKGRVFDYTRLGGRKFNLENAVLELRKIPQGLNSITQLNNHFRRFGRIVNLQVCYEGDPEAALIQFSSHAEAHAAYRSTEAVLNNRFIKVFWHNQNKDDASPLSWPNNVSVVKKLSAKERLGLPLQKSSVNEPNVPPPEEVEKSSVTLATSGTLSKTVFNLAALKKSNVSTISPSVPPAAMKTHQAVAAKETIKKKQEEQRKEAMKINVDLQKRKQELIQKQIQQQKILIEKLEKNKNLTVVEKTTIMTTLKLLQESIEKLKTELVASATLQTTSHPKTKQEAQREILDIEMELYAKQHQGGDTTELRKKVADLKQEALSLGLIDSKFPLGRGRGLTRRLVRGASSAFRGRGRLAGARSLDHRPRTLQVMGFEDSEKEEVVAHLSNFGDIENLDVDESGSKLVVSYRNRREAETAALQGAKFKGRVLMMVWHQVSGAHGANDGHDGLADGLTGDEELLEQETENEDLLLGDDDEEEDSEARSWRR